MPTLEISRIAELVQPFIADLPELPSELYSKLSEYLDLLLRWNTRTNLTAIREPEEIVTRHFGESLFAAVRLRDRLNPGATLLDFGSGAGFPGIPIKLMLPQLKICLGESQIKKVSFLREAIRTLGLPVEVWSSRIEDMPPSRTFDCVTLRAVDNMALATTEARRRVASGGLMAILGSSEAPPQTEKLESFPLPCGHSRILYLCR